MGKVSKKEIASGEKTASSLNEFQGFKILPVIVDPSKNVRHYLYMRKHESKSLVDEDLRDRTLFLLNLPADTTDHHIHRLFKGHSIDYITCSDSDSTVSEDYWKIIEEKETAEKERKKMRKKNRKLVAKGQEVIVVKKRELRKLYTSGSSAHIVFDSTDTLNNVLNMKRVEKKWAKDEDERQPLGFERYIMAYDLSRPSTVELQNEVDLFMKKFKDDEYQNEREKLERMNKMDDDGFTVVVRHKKAKTTDGSIHVGSVATEVAEQLPYIKKKKELINFYRFQMREQKQNELTDLRRKFEEDKQKIAQLKQSRKFKPY